VEISICLVGGVGIDLSCNTIVDVSGIYFCDGPIGLGNTYIGPGTSFDISTNQVFKIKTTDASNALVVDQSGNIGVGTNLPTTATNFDIANNPVGTTPGLTLKRIDNTIALGTNIGTIQFAGAVAGDTATPNIGAIISGQAAETWAAGGNAGANIRFSTTINSSGGLGFHEMMRITEDGTVGIFHNTLDGFNPTASNILQIRTTLDGAILMETTGSSTQATLKLANIPLSSGTSSVAEVGYIQFEASDGGMVKNICQIKGELTVGSPFTGELHFHTMQGGMEGERMRLSGINSAVTPLISLNGDTNTGFFHQSSDVIGFTTGGVERARLSAGGGGKLELAVGGTIANLTLCGLTAGGNEENCGLSLNSATALQMGVDNGSGTAALRMQMSSIPSQAITFAANAGGTGTPVLTISDSIATGNLTSPHGIIVDNSGVILGGIARKSLQVVSNWQDGHLGNCEKLYFTATDFFTTDVSGGRYGMLNMAPGGTLPSPTMAYGTNNWIATKLLPVGFQIPDNAKINILGQWANVSPPPCTQGIANLYVVSTAVTTNGQRLFPTPPCLVIAGHEAVPTQHVVTYSGGTIKTLNVEHTLGSASSTSGTGSYPSAPTGGRTVIVSIYVELENGLSMT